MLPEYSYKINWTKEKKDYVIDRITQFICKYPYGETIMQSDCALIESPDLLSEIADYLQPELIENSELDQIISRKIDEIERGMFPNLTGLTLTHLHYNLLYEAFLKYLKKIVEETNSTVQTQNAVEWYRHVLLVRKDSIR